MAAYYLDTSALIKQYINELGSTWIRGLCATQFIGVLALALAEVSSVFARLYREGTLSTHDRNALLHAFHLDVVQFALFDIDRPLLARAGAILINVPAAAALRSLDAIQLASAQTFAASTASSGLGPLTFVSADTRLIAAAQWAGFAVDDPNNHP